MTLAILIPAAGFSSRMNGRDKLAENIEGQPLLRVIANRALQVTPKVVVAIPKDHARAEMLRGLAVSIAIVEDPSAGMGASIALAARCVEGEVNGIMILPADMPDITTRDIKTIQQEFDKTHKITRGCTKSGDVGHPVFFPAEFLEPLRHLNSDTGARDLLRGHEVEKVALPNDHAITDLDTPEDWSNWRGNQP